MVRVPNRAVFVRRATEERGAMNSALLAAMPAFTIYTFIQSITPGPANLCSLATTMQQGVRPAMRQWVGLTIGLFIVVAVTTVALLGAGDVVDQLMPVLTVVGAGYVLWLAWGMVRPGQGSGAARIEPTIKAGVILQVTNVRLLVMCTTALLAYVIPYTNNPLVMAIVSLVIPAMGAASGLVWIYGGARLQTWYEGHHRLVDIVMGAALALCGAGMLTMLF